ncbi:MAG: putative toxin-antitoxin system toxin component, PIN family [Proteobacteria bacterium]|nr:putative toxin-antitoxin system toxin component, PIN family [Pseudomonadota bacterium]
MRIFLDTNVLASAVATRGLCADVLREVLARHDLIISNALLKELKRVLQKKFSVPSQLISGFIAMLQQDTILAAPIDSPGIQIKDKDDIIILAAALSAEAELFITGDKELLELEKVGNLKIISPRAFWDRLTA